MRRLWTTSVARTLHHAPELLLFSARWKARKANDPVEDLRLDINGMASRKDAAGAVDCLWKAMQSGVLPTGQIVATTLFICEKHGDRGTALNIIKHLDSAGFKWDERTLVVGLRLMCHANDLAGGQRVFRALVQSGWAKNRSVSPMLQLCLRLASPAESMFHQKAIAEVLDVVKASSIELNDEDYAAVFSVYEKCGVAIGAKDSGLLDAHLAALAEHTTTMSPATAERLLEWIGSDASTSGAAGVTALEAEVTESGMCKTCGTQLVGVPFTSKHREELLHNIKSSLVAAKCRNARAKANFETFCRYIATVSPSVIIDGANLGYYGVSKWHGAARNALKATRLRRRQQGGPAASIHSDNDAVPPDFPVIQEAIDEVQKLGLRPLVLLHERHGELHNQTEVNEALFREWRAKQLVYTTPSGLNDDLCWLYGCVFLNKNPERHAGPECFVLSNDLMRDHHFALLSKRSFVRWRDRHQIKFVCERVNNATRVKLALPAAFSACVQPVKIDGSIAGWHIPVVDSSENGAKSDPEGDGGVYSSDFPDEQPAESVVDAPPSATTWLCLRRSAT